MFSKRHYEAIARLASPGENPGEFVVSVEDLIMLFERDNPAFKRDRFLDATAAAWPKRLSSNTAIGLNPSNVLGALK